MTCFASIKKSNKRGLWQIKEPDHNLISLSHAHDVIEKCLFLEHIDFTRRDLVHNFYFSDSEIEDYTMHLKYKEGSWHIVDNEISGSGFFPDEMFKLFEKEPVELFIRITEGTKRKSLTDITLC